MRIHPWLPQTSCWNSPVISFQKTLENHSLLILFRIQINITWTTASFTFTFVTRDEEKPCRRTQNGTQSAPNQRYYQNHYDNRYTHQRIPFFYFHIVVLLYLFVFDPRIWWWIRRQQQRISRRPGLTPRSSSSFLSSPQNRHCLLKIFFNWFLILSNGAIFF